jgi:DNA-binding transcriptional MerR regulator
MNNAQPAPLTETEIPDKLFFKIGEVCDLVGVQAHVLRYWESEFPSFQPQKNRAGQRTYRRKDVEMALRIKILLYGEGFTIAGAKRKLITEGRSNAPRLKIVPPNATAETLMEDGDGGRMIAEPAAYHHATQAAAQAAPEPAAPAARTSARAASNAAFSATSASSDGLQRLKFQIEDILTTLNANVLD